MIENTIKEEFLVIYIRGIKDKHLSTNNKIRYFPTNKIQIT
jgi:hypothetical protein